MTNLYSISFSSAELNKMNDMFRQSPSCRVAAMLFEFFMFALLFRGVASGSVFEHSNDHCHPDERTRDDIVT